MYYTEGYNITSVYFLYNYVLLYIYYNLPHNLKQFV